MERWLSKQNLNDHILELLDLDDMYDKVRLLSIEDDSIREKVLVYRTYYDFLENDECLYQLEKIFMVISKNNDYKSKKDLIHLSIIILKSFLEFKISEVSIKFLDSNDIFNYVSDQYEKYLILRRIYLSEKKIQTFVLYLLDLLVQNNVVEQKIIKYRGSYLKTYKYYSITIQTYSNCFKDFYSFSYIGFKLIEYQERIYIASVHYSKMYELSKKNYNSGKSFKIKDMSYIMNKTNLKVYVDHEYQLSLQKKFTLNLSELKIKLEENLDLLNLTYEQELWTIETKEEISKIQKKISKLNQQILYFHFAYFEFGDTPIIFPMYLDFRGRKYYHSSIGPTNAKILRLAYYYGYYDSSDFDSSNNLYSLEHLNLIKAFCRDNNFLFHTKYLESYFWLLIGIGKIVRDKNKIVVSTIDFLELGISYLKVPKKVDLESLLEIEHYITIMKSFSNSKIKKRLVIKDATASLNQIFMKKIGPLNNLSLNYVNLGCENIWYDTYLVFREKFYEKIISDKIFEEYHDRGKFELVLNRKAIKNTIMIIPYSAGFQLCWQNYIDLNKNEGFGVEITKTLKSFYESFYKYIKDQAQTDFLYRKNTKTLTNKMVEEFESARVYIVDSHSGSADLAYYKLKKSPLDKKYEENGVKKRITKLILKPTNALDIEAFSIAAGANIVHFWDAAEIRIIESKLGYVIITIHDSYLIDFLNCSKLVRLKLEHYQKSLEKFGRKIMVSNIFILL